MGKTILKWIILILLLGYSAAVTVWARSEAARNSCRGIDVEVENQGKADSVTRSGVLAELAHYPRKIIGTPLESLNTYDIRQFLSRLSNFESVDCVVTTDGMLKVNVVPMVPELRVFTPMGSYYINKDGKHIPSNAEFYVDVPVVKGTFTNKMPATYVLPVTRFIESDPVMRDLVAMIEVTDKDNIILIPRIQGHVINFGDTSRLREKKRALMTMYNKIMPYKGWNEYDTISVRFRDQIVATRRQKAAVDHGPVVDDGYDPEEAALSSMTVETSVPGNL